MPNMWRSEPPAVAGFQLKNLVQVSIGYSTLCSIECHPLSGLKSGFPHNGPQITLRNKKSDRVPIGILGFSFSLRILIEKLLGFWWKQNLS